MALAHDSQSESHTGASGSANQSSFSWTHTPGGTPRSVLVQVFTFADAADVTSVTYGGVALGAVSGGEAICTDGDEDGRCTVYHLGAGIPTGAQTVTVTRTNNADIMYATCWVATAAADTEVYAPGIVLQQSVGTLAEQSPSDGSPGTNSIRYAAITSGLDSAITTGANSTGTTSTSIDIGTKVAKSNRETAVGQGARPVGFTSGTSEDRAAVYLAVREVASGPAATGTPSLPNLAAGASGTLGQSAAGAPALPGLMHAAAGVAQQPALATGADGLPHMRASGQGVHRQIATAIAVLPNLATVGTGLSVPTTAGASMLPALTASGLATSVLIAEVAASIDIAPALTATIDITSAVDGRPGLEH